MYRVGFPDAAYSLASIVGVAVAPALAIAARPRLFKPPFRTACRGSKSIFSKIKVPTIATIKAMTTGVVVLQGCISPSLQVTEDNFLLEKKDRLRCHKRPKSREETPKEGSDSGWGTGGRYRIPYLR